MLKRSGTLTIGPDAAWRSVATAMRQVYVEGSGLALPAFPPDLRHVTAVAADRFAALLAGPPGFGRRKLVGRPTLVGGTSALGGNLPLTLLTHAGKTTATAGRPPGRGRASPTTCGSRLPGRLGRGARPRLG